MFNFKNLFTPTKKHKILKETPEFSDIRKEVFFKLELLDKTNKHIKFVSRAELDFIKVQESLDRYIDYVETPYSAYYEELIFTAKAILNQINLKLE